MPCKEASTVVVDHGSDAQSLIASELTVTTDTRTDNFSAYSWRFGDLGPAGSTPFGSERDPPGPEVLV
jgi:hypothetical protein